MTDPSVNQTRTAPMVGDFETRDNPAIRSLGISRFFPSVSITIGSPNDSMKPVTRSPFRKTISSEAFAIGG